MPDMLPWLEPPRNKAEFQELEANMQALAEELYAKLLIVSAVTNQRLRKPKSDSKWAARLAWARVDLKAYARSVSKPIAGAGGAAIAMGKAMRLSYRRFYDINATAAQVNDGGASRSGFDFS